MCKLIILFQFKMESVLVYQSFKFFFQKDCFYHQGQNTLLSFHPFLVKG